MKKTVIIFILIMLLGVFLRVYKLDKFPPSLFGDEADVGYQAYSILKTGKDYSGQSWPISFRSISDWRTPLFLYADVPFIAVFGLNEWGVRLCPAFFGIITLPFFYLLIKKLFKDKKTALLGMFFLAISMWHLQYSRAAFEATLMLFLIIVAVYFFLRGLEKWKYLILSAIMFALAPYSYNTAKFFIPLFIVFLVIIFQNELKKVPLKKLLVMTAVFVVVSLPMLVDIFYGKAADRFSILSIFTDPTTVGQIGFARQVDLGLSGSEVVLDFKPTVFSRFYHNKFTFWGLTFLQNYFKAFSTNFLFVFGDINYRHSIQGGFGEFYWPDIVFLLAGLFYLFLSKNKLAIKLIIGWILLAPIPSALTRDGANHATRLILLLPPVLIVVSFGLISVLESIKKEKLKVAALSGIILIYGFSFIFYLHRYYVHYPVESEEWWNYGFKQLGQYVNQNSEKYDYMIYSDLDEPPLIYTLFWNKVDPKIVQNNKLVWTEINSDLKTDYLPQTKYYFGHIDEEKMKNYQTEGILKQNYLYLMPGGETGVDYRNNNPPGGMNLLQTVSYPSGRVAKYIFTGK